MLLGSQPEFSSACLTGLYFPSSYARQQCRRAVVKHKEWWRLNAKLYWNVELNRKVPFHSDVPTEFFSCVNQWIYYKKEDFVMQCSHHYNLVRLIPTACGEELTEIYHSIKCIKTHNSPLLPFSDLQSAWFESYFLTKALMLVIHNHSSFQHFSPAGHAKGMQRKLTQLHRTSVKWLCDLSLILSRNMLPFLMLTFPRLFL